MQKIAVVKFSMKHTKKTGVWPKQHKVLGSIPVRETCSPIFHLIPNEIKHCGNVFAPLVRNFVLAQIDKTGCPLQLLLAVSDGCQNLPEVVSDTFLLALLLTYPDILLLMKKKQLWPAS